MEVSSIPEGFKVGHGGLSASAPHLIDVEMLHIAVETGIDGRRRAAGMCGIVGFVENLGFGKFLSAKTFKTDG